MCTVEDSITKVVFFLITLNNFAFFFCKMRNLTNKVTIFSHFIGKVQPK